MMYFTMDTSDVQKFTDDMEKAAALVPGSLEQGMTEVTLLVEGTAKSDYLRGPRPRRLGVVSGALRNSLRHSVKRRGGVVEGRVIAGKGSKPLKYARIHEYGGVIVPKTKKSLRFKGKDGTYVFTKRVVMPARPFLEPAFKDHHKDAEEILGQKVYALIE